MWRPGGSLLESRRSESAVRRILAQVGTRVAELRRAVVHGQRAEARRVLCAPILDYPRVQHLPEIRPKPAGRAAAGGMAGRSGGARVSRVSPVAVRAGERVHRKDARKRCSHVVKWSLGHVVTWSLPHYSTIDYSTTRLPDYPTTGQEANDVLHSDTHRRIHRDSVFEIRLGRAHHHQPASGVQRLFDTCAD